MSDVGVKVEAVGDEVRVVVIGDVDMANVDRIAAGINEAITNQVTSATLDLSNVGYLDSAGLRLLFDLAVRLPTLQIVLVVVAPPGSPARRVIDMTGLASVTTVVP